MKLLIVGSYRKPEGEAGDHGDGDREKRFIEACRELGTELAKAGTVVLICSGSTVTADYHVVKSMDATKSKSKHSVIIYYLNEFEEIEKIKAAYTDLKNTELTIAESSLAA